MTSTEGKRLKLKKKKTTKFFWSQVLDQCMRDVPCLQERLQYHPSPNAVFRQHHQHSLHLPQGKQDKYDCSTYQNQSIAQSRRQWTPAHMVWSSAFDFLTTSLPKQPSRSLVKNVFCITGVTSPGKQYFVWSKRWSALCWKVNVRQGKRHST